MLFYKTGKSEFHFGAPSQSVRFLSRRDFQHEARSPGFQPPRMKLHGAFNIGDENYELVNAVANFH